MNLDQLYTVEDHGKGAKMLVIDQFGQETDFSITFVGVDSKKWREIYRKNQRKLVGLSGDDLMKTIADNSASILAEAALDWSGAVDSKGAEIKFSKKGIEDLLNNAPYIKEQADEFVAKRGNFIKS